ncbi:hypothetical protein GOV05_05540 [Candidatus Woesearchaeota archaeon]|nr:hypothetical protein [Candidatus Woesearchaeota archaeon]
MTTITPKEIGMVLLYAFPVLIFGIITLVKYLIRNSRSNLLAQKAAEHGYPFSKNQQVPNMGFELFDKGWFKKASNNITIKKRGKKWELFDFFYKEGGKNGRYYTQSVALVECDLPEFVLRPESFLDRLSDKFVKRDIDFEQSPIFSEKYVLKSEDINIKTFFSSQIQSYFAQREDKVCVESKNNNVIIYKENKKVKPEEINKFIDEANRLLDLFERNNPLTK